MPDGKLALRPPPPTVLAPQVRVLITARFHEIEKLTIGNFVAINRERRYIYRVPLKLIIPTEQATFSSQTKSYWTCGNLDASMIGRFIEQQEGVGLLYFVIDFYPHAATTRAFRCTSADAQSQHVQKIQRESVAPGIIVAECLFQCLSQMFCVVLVNPVHPPFDGDWR